MARRSAYFAASISSMSFFRRPLTSPPRTAPRLGAGGESNRARQGRDAPGDQARPGDRICRAFGFREIIFLLHAWVLPYCRTSAGRPPRRDDADRPRSASISPLVAQPPSRFPGHAERDPAFLTGAMIPVQSDRASGSRKTVIASSNVTPCLTALLAAFAGSQSKSMRTAHVAAEGAVLKGRK